MALELRILESGDEPFVDWYDLKSHLDFHEKDTFNHLLAFKWNI